MKNILIIILLLVAVFQFKTWLDESDLYYKLDKITNDCTIDMIINDELYCD